MINKLRNYYKPFEYQWSYDYYRLQQSVHWTKDEIKLSEDLKDWSQDLTLTEKEVIGGILKGFVQAEVLVGDYWRKVAEWFPKPEIQMMAATFSYFEGIHIDSYSMLNEELGLADYKAFVQDEHTKSKLDYLIDTKSESIEEIAKSLAIFSAFTEGVLIFSSFAVLLSFQKENLLKGVGQIVSYSIRDEDLHSKGGIQLFNTLCEETKGLKERCEKDILIAANIVYELETSFIDSIFNGFNEIRTINKNDLKNFVAFRINLKLNEIGYSPIMNVNKEAVHRMSWFDSLSRGREFGDFFATRVTEYTKTEFEANDLF